MIVKIYTHKRPDFRKLLEYMLNDPARMRDGHNPLFDKDEKTFVITHNLKGDTIDDWVKQYKENENYRQHKRKNSVYLTHEIISFHREDKISLEKLETIAREYIRQRNPNGIYVAVPHFDKEHYHVHICASGIEYRTGKTMRLPKTELQKLKQNIQQYQIEKFPELNNSIVQHGIKKEHALSDREYQYKQRTGRASEKEMINEMLKRCFKEAKSQEDFFKRIVSHGLELYKRSGIITGIRYHGRKYRFKRLGCSEDRLKDMEVRIKRGSELGKMREKKEEVEKDIEK